MLGATAVNGGVLAGQGSTYDAVIENKSLAVAMGVLTGTQNVVLGGNITAASLITTGTISGALCQDASGHIIYAVAVNCFAVSGITVVSGKTLTIDNTLELAGTDGTKFTFPGASDTVDTLAATQTVSGVKTFSGTFNCTGTCQLAGTAFGTFATQNFATPPAIGGTTPAAGSFSILAATTPIGLSSGGSNNSTAAGARGPTGYNIDELTSHGDSNYPILSTDRVVATSATLTAPRTWTLPAASSVNAGQYLFVQDFKGFVSNTNTLTIIRNGSDNINGGTGSVVINNANGGFLFISDGVSNWSAQALGAQATAGVASINGQTGNPSIVAGTGISVSTTGGNISVANTGLTSLICDGGQVTITTTGTCPSRWLLTANQSFYVRSDGNDTSCTGLTNAAYVSGSFPQNCGWLTLQKAANYLAANVDTGSFTATVQTACATPPCTFSAGVQQLQHFTGSGLVLFQGDTTTPSNQVISVNASAAFQSTYNSTRYQVAGFKLINANVGGSGIYASGGGQIDIVGKMEFGAVGGTSGSQIEMNHGAVYNSATAWTVSGGGARHIYIHNQGYFENAAAVTVTVSGAPAFTNTVLLTTLGVGNAASMTYSGACTGQRYAILNNSDMETNGGGANYFCGGVAGGVATGGIYN